MGALTSGVAGRLRRVCAEMALRASLATAAVAPTNTRKSAPYARHFSGGSTRGAASAIPIPSRALSRQPGWSRRRYRVHARLSPCSPAPPADFSQRPPTKSSRYKQALLRVGHGKCPATLTRRAEDKCTSYNAQPGPSSSFLRLCFLAYFCAFFDYRHRR